MSEDSQIVVPPAFIALFIPPGRMKPTQAPAHIAARHEFCEDLAQLLMEQAQTLLFSLGVTESDVLQRIHRGLLVDGSGLTTDEAGWVQHRLAELLGWPQPAT